MTAEDPLVSILIPTYNRANYFQIALKSALAQTYSNIEIIVVDDSTNLDTYHLIQPYLQQYPHIKYYKNHKNIGGALNFIKCYEYSTGEYINYLMDDDIFHPHKIKTMLQYFLNDTSKQIKLITSYFSLIDENGNVLPHNVYSHRKFKQITIVDGTQAGDSLVSEFNWIGVPTIPLFRKNDLSLPFGVFSDRLYRSGVDIAAWLNLLSKGDVLYIPDSLSQLRLHSHNIGKDNNMQLYAIEDLLHLLFHCKQNGFLKEDSEYKKALDMVQQIFNHISQRFPLNIPQKRSCNYYSLLLKKLMESYTHT
ncbi:MULTISPECIES: glycosyltransferase family 2 protein [Bacillus]|uniref:Glycosyltransferase 2-like domain-containing protein n=1 Tax=Bacillus cereus TaxID=1396 RepID=A0A9X6GDE2_BACCE|nr:glycosyltransferase family 2 protein [Bacillus cereus]OOR72375.1 hypothetical protein BLX06_25160 [Bacillus cereus]